MPKDTEGGLRDAVKGAVGGAILSAILNVIPGLGIVPSDYVVAFQMFELVFLVGSILAISQIEYMKFGYLIGWLFGTWIMSIIGLVENWLFVLYATIGGIVLLDKILRKAKL